MHDHESAMSRAATSRGASKMRWLKWSVLLLLLCAAVAVWRFDGFARVREPLAVARTLADLGPWGYVAFLMAYACLQPFGIPGSIFVFAASLIWPWRTALALSLVGTMGATVAGFSFARFMARDWVSKRLPARLHRYDTALQQNAFATVVMMRLIFWMAPWLHSFFGVSKVRFRTHFWGSLIGYLPPLVVISYFGSSLLDASGKMQWPPWPVVAVFCAASLALGAAGWAWQRWSTSASLSRQ